MMTCAELEAFFTGLVGTTQARGIVCAITSGMAWMHFGVATKQDCDGCARRSRRRIFSR